MGGKLYVSDEGGRQAQPGDTTMDSYGTQVPANGYLGTSTTGAVSVIDPANPSAAVGSISVGLHPTAMYSPAKGALFVANTNGDTVSVIDTKKDKVVQTIETKPWPSSDVGYAPTSIAMTTDGHLLVTLGRANAVAVYQYHGDPQEPVSYIGLVPTDYYPATVATVGDQIVVTNTRGIDARGPELSINKGPGTVVAVGHGTHSTTGSLTRFTLPSDQDIAKLHRHGLRAERLGQQRRPAGSGNKAAAVPVPTRIGDPSTIKHVFLLVKENRTYDQVYGDMARGQRRPEPGAVRREGHAEPARAGQAVRPLRQRLRRRHELRRGPQLADAGRQPRVHRVVRGRVPAQLRHRGGRARPPALGLPVDGRRGRRQQRAQLRRVRVHRGQAVRDVAAVLLRGQERRERR